MTIDELEEELNNLLGSAVSIIVKSNGKITINTNMVQDDTGELIDADEVDEDADFVRPGDEDEHESYDEDDSDDDE